MALGTTFVASAVAQVDLSLVSTDLTLIGDHGEGVYFAEDASIDAALRIRAQVFDAADRQAFDADLHLVGIDSGSCSDASSLPADCEHFLASLSFDPREIDVHLAPTGARKVVSLDLTEPGVEDLDRFVSLQRAAGRSVHVRVSLDTGGVYADDPNPANNVGLSSSTGLLPLSGTLLFDDVPTSLSAFQGQDDCGFFLSGLRVENAQAEWQPASGDTWPPRPIELDASHCVDPVVGPSEVLDLQLSHGTVEVLAVSGQLGGLELTVSAADLTESGVNLGDLSVLLPVAASFHPVSATTGLPRTRGLAELVLTGASWPASNDLNDLSFSFDLGAAGESGFLQPADMPIAFRVDVVTIDDRGLSALWEEVHYHYNQPFGVSDPRAATGAPSNDGRMRFPIDSGLADSERTLLVDRDGLHSQAFFAAGDASTHFPQLEIQFSTFTLGVESSRVAAGQTLPASAADDYTLSQRPHCPDCGDAGSLPIPEFDTSPSVPQGMGADGSVIAHIETIGEEAAWGPDDGASRMFERTDDSDLPGLLYLPGYRAELPDVSEIGGLTVPAYLLGMRAVREEAGAFQPDTLFPLGFPEAQRGNHFMAGLTVGPELLIGELGAAEAGIGVFLDGRSTRIGFGGATDPDFHAVPASSSSKYVVRPGGVTGVFNSIEAPQPTLYGFDVALSRFAFRQVSNAIDSETWMDGVVTVPEPGDVRVALESMDLRCTGDVDGAQVVGEICNELDDNGNGLVDENCNERLAAWQTPYDIQSAEFRAADDVPACEASPRTFMTRGIATLHALDDDLTLEADWNAEGRPEQAEVFSQTDHKLDRPDVDTASPESEAFEVALDGEIEMLTTPDENAGWYQFDALLGLHFWDDIPVDLRLQNRDLELPEQTLVYKRGQLQSIDDQEILDNSAESLAQAMRNSQPAHSRAVYDWVGSINFDLPIYYEAGRHDLGLQPSFAGRADLQNISFLETKAKVDFITPERTSLSFGATADLDPLVLEANKVALRVDLRNDESVDDIDLFFQQYLLIPAPEPGEPRPVRALVDIVGQLQNNIGCFDAHGLEGCAETKLRQRILEEFTVPDTDPPELTHDQVVEGMNRATGDAEASVAAAQLKVCEALYTVGAAPAMVMAVCPAVMPRPAAPFGSADARMLDLYFDGALAIQAQHAACTAPVTPAEIAACNAMESAVVDDLRSDLQDAVADIVQVRQDLEGTQDDITSLRDDLESLATDLGSDLPAAIEALVEAREDLATSGLDVCSDATGPDGWLNTVGDVNDIMIDIVEKLDFEGMVIYSLIAGYAGFDGQEVAEALVAFKQLADDLVPILTPSLTAAEQLFDCESAEGPNLGTVLTGAETFLADLETRLGDLQAGMDAFLSLMLEDGDADGVPDNPPYTGQIGALEQVMADTVATLAVVEDLLNGLESEIDISLMSSPPAPIVLPTVGVPGLVPPPPPASAADVRTYFDDLVAGATEGRYTWLDPATGNSVVLSLQADASTSLFTVKTSLDSFQQGTLAQTLEAIPNLENGEHLVDLIVDLVMNDTGLGELLTTADTLLTEPLEALSLLSDTLLDRIAVVIREVLESLASLRSKLFTAEDRKVLFSPLSKLDEIDGFAKIRRDELEGLHLLARFDLLHEIRDDLFEARVGIDVTPWSARGSSNSTCHPATSDDLLDIVIRLDAHLGDSGTLFGHRVTIDSLYGRIVRQSGRTVGVSLGLSLKRGGVFQAFKMDDMTLVGGATRVRRYCVADPGTECQLDADCGVGDVCTNIPQRNRGRCNMVDPGERWAYKEGERCKADGDCEADQFCQKKAAFNEGFLGGNVRSSFAGFGVNAGLLVGQTCSEDPLATIDPQAEQFITLPNDIFRGVYTRGGITLPIVELGCPLSLRAGLDVGSWFLGGPPASVGGLVNGSLTGQVLCLGGLRGQLTAFGEKSGSGFRFGGQAFGVAGVGPRCDPHTWTSVSRSRKDKWCATGDGQTTVVIDRDGLNRSGLDFSGLH